MKVKSESEVSQLCLTLSDPMDCSPPGSAVHGIFQARALEWGAIAFSGGQEHNLLMDFRGGEEERGDRKKHREAQFLRVMNQKHQERLGLSSCLCRRGR